MPLFRYEAISEKGKKFFGTMNADNIQDAKLQLVRKKIGAIHLFPLDEKEVLKPLGKKDVLFLTRDLSRLLQAGLPLYEALSALEEKYRKQKSHHLLLDLAEGVRNGLSLSKTLQKHPLTFDLLYIAMIANAEKTGRLSFATSELTVLMKKQIAMRKQIIQAFLYPGLLTLFCFVVVVSLLFFVIPSLQELFEGRDLHPFTQIVFAISHYACQFQSALIVALIGIVSLIVFGLRSPKIKRNFLQWICCFPFVKPFCIQAALVRFCRAFATLLEGGLPLLGALSQAKNVMQHPVLEQTIGLIEQKVAQGEKLSSAFSSGVLIPPLIPRMIAIAEQSGKLSFTMQQISEIYEEELESYLIHFSAAAQPILLILLGSLVGFVLLSVLLPLTDVGSFVN